MNEWSGSVYWWTGVFTVSELTLRDSWCCLLGELLSVSLPEHKIGRLHQVPNSKYIHLFLLSMPQDSQILCAFGLCLLHRVFLSWWINDIPWKHDYMTHSFITQNTNCSFFLLVAEVTASSDCQSIKWVRDSVRFFWEIKNSMLSIFRCPQAC